MPQRRHRSLTPRALLLALLLACSEAEGSRSVPVERDVRDLLAALQPIEPTTLPADRSDRLRRQRLTLERLRVPDPELGAAVRQAYLDGTDLADTVRAGLLDVAAHADPEGTREILLELFEAYGEPMELRRQATVLLGAAWPEKVIEVVEPALIEVRDEKTYPPPEFLLESAVTAYSVLERDPTKLLARLATDLRQDDRVRQRSIQLLGEGTTERGLRALENVLIESTGNGYLRRKAAQALLSTTEADHYCPIFERVFDRESEDGFRRFLADVISEHCR